MFRRAWTYDTQVQKNTTDPSLTVIVGYIRSSGIIIF